MNRLLRPAALVLALLAISGVVLWANVVNRYVEASRVQVELPGNVGFADVVIPPIVGNEDVVTVGVLFAVRNPSGIPIEVIAIPYRFFMDNVSDTRPFPDKDETIFVASGGYFASTSPAVVDPHAVALVWANMSVHRFSQPVALERLNRTFNGVYFPIIEAGLVYRIPGTEIVDSIVGIWFASETGVVPRAT